MERKIGQSNGAKMRKDVVKLLHGRGEDPNKTKDTMGHLSIIAYIS